MKELWHLSKQVGFLKAIRLIIGDRWRRFQGWRRQYQPGRRLVCSNDYKRRHQILQMLLDHENNQYHEDMNYPRWKDGMNLHQITEALGIYDGEVGLQLSALREDLMLHEEKNNENHLTYFSLNRKGAAAFRSGHYLREGSREKGPMVSIAISILAILLSGWQTWSASQQSDRIDDLKEQVLLLQQSRTEPSTEAPSSQETNHAPPVAVEVLCGPCVSIPEKKKSEKKK